MPGSASYTNYNSNQTPLHCKSYTLIQDSLLTKLVGPQEQTLNKSPGQSLGSYNEHSYQQYDQRGQDAKLEESELDLRNGSVFGPIKRMHRK
jgi:hypothetical protein